MYLTKGEELYGEMIVKKDCILFEPFEPEREDLHPELDLLESNIKLIGKHAEVPVDYSAKIDYLDIIELNKLNLVNENAVTSEFQMMRENYKYNVFI